MSLLGLLTARMTGWWLRLSVCPPDAGPWGMSEVWLLLVTQSSDTCVPASQSSESEQSPPWKLPAPQAATCAWGTWVPLRPGGQELPPSLFHTHLCPWEWQLGRK